VSFSWCIFIIIISPRTQYNAYIAQAAKDVWRGQDTLVDIFEHIESFFRRLEIYTQVPPTTEMTETIIQIMAEVLSIIGIATKEIRQGWLSKLFSASMILLTERCSETFAKKLIGRTDMEDALKRLDKLTVEEARMATAEVLRTTHAIDEGVKGVREQVLGVDDKVAEVINGG
jgi:hypothetical protein